MSAGIIAAEETCKACAVRTHAGFDGQCPACANERTRAALRAERAALSPPPAAPVSRKGVFKRTANVPVAVRRLPVSKADLLEVAWSLAAIAHDGGCDDAAATFTRLLEELNLFREQRGVRRLSNDRFDKVRS